MRNHAVVSPLFWTGETGRFLRKHPDAQRLALYLVTCPSSNMTGLYYLSMAQIQNDLGLNSEGASEALRRAIEGAFCLYDESAEVVFVPEMARFQVAEKLSKKDKRSAGVMNQLKPFHKHQFYTMFMEKYAADFNLSNGSPSKGASKALRRGIAQEQEQEQEQENTAPSPAAQATAPKADKKERKKPTGDHADLCEYFRAQWAINAGKEYPEFETKDYANLAAVLRRAGSLAEATAAVDRYMRERDKFFIGHPVGKLLSDLPRFTADHPTGNGMPPPHVCSSITKIIQREKE